MAPTSRVMAASLGKIPTTLVRRLTSAWSRSIGFVECNFWRCSLGKWNGRLPPLMLADVRVEVDPRGPGLPPISGPALKLEFGAG